MKMLKNFFGLERNVVVFAVSNIIVVAGFFIYDNFLPKFYEALGASAVAIGLLFMVESSSQQIAHLLGGYWADKYGRKYIYLLSLLLSIPALFIFLFSKSWLSLIPAVVLTGLSGGIGGTSGSVLITESVRKNKRATSWSIVQLGGVATTLVSVPLGGLLIERFGILLGFKIGVLVAIICSITAFIILKLYLIETLKRTAKKKIKIGLSSALNFFNSLPRKLKLYFLFIGLVFFYMALVRPYIILYAMDIVKIDPLQYSLLVTLTAVISAIFLLTGGKVSDKYGRKFALLVGLSIETVSIIILLVSKNFAHLILFAIFTGASTLYTSSILPYVADYTPTKTRAKSLGIANFVMMLSSAPAPLIGGYLYHLSPSLPFVTLILLSFVALGLGYKILK